MADARTLVLLRHGQTAWNLQRRAQGHADIPLDETGERQARRAAVKIAALGPALIRASDLGRARQTAQAVAAECGLEVVLDARLREYDVGERSGTTWDESIQAVESHVVVADRMLAAFRATLNDLAPGEIALVVAHGASLRTGLAALLGLPLTAASALHGMGNCHWASVRVDGSGVARLIDYNRS